MIVRLGLLALGAAASASIAAPRGDCRLCVADPKARVATEDKTDSMSLQVEAGLVFDGLILRDDGSGSAVIRPDGTTEVGGSVAAISARAMVGRAQVTGQPGRYVTVGLPRQIELYSASGGRLVIDSIESDLPPAPRLDSRGILRFRFGGRLQVQGSAEGTYRGEIPVTADYL